MKKENQPPLQISALGKFYEQKYIFDFGGVYWSYRGSSWTIFIDNIKSHYSETPKDSDDSKQIRPSYFVHLTARVHSVKINRPPEQLLSRTTARNTILKTPNCKEL